MAGKWPCPRGCEFCSNVFLLFPPHFFLFSKHLSQPFLPFLKEPRSRLPRESVFLDCALGQHLVCISPLPPPPPRLPPLACTWKPSCLCSAALIFPSCFKTHFQKDPPFEGLLPVPAPRIATWLLALSCQEAVLPELAVSSQLPKSSGNFLSLAPEAPDATLSTPPPLLRLLPPWVCRRPPSRFPAACFFWKRFLPTSLITLHASPGDPVSPAPSSLGSDMHRRHWLKRWMDRWLNEHSRGVSREPVSPGMLHRGFYTRPCRTSWHVNC